MTLGNPAYTNGIHLSGIWENSYSNFNPFDWDMGKYGTYLLDMYCIFHTAIDNGQNLYFII